VVEERRKYLPVIRLWGVSITGEPSEDREKKMSGCISLRGEGECVGGYPRKGENYLWLFCISAERQVEAPEILLNRSVVPKKKKTTPENCQKSVRVVRLQLGGLVKEGEIRPIQKL